MAESEATKTYRVKSLPVKEQKGKKLDRNPSISENGGVYGPGMTIELTPSRMKQIGEEFFEEVKDSKKAEEPKKEDPKK